MKKSVLSFIFVFLQLCIFAQGNEHYLKIQINDRSELDILTRMVSIDNVIGNEVIAYANDRELEKLSFSTFVFEKLEPPLSEVKASSMANTVAELMANWDKYPIMQVYNDLMVKYVADFPNLCKLDIIGTSVQGRNIPVLHITSDILNPQPKPEVLLSSTMHGDETTGWMLCLRLAHYLLSNYGTIPRITQMLDSVSIFIVPNTNPDGTYYGSAAGTSISTARRSNYNGYDLNRNFPDPWEGPNYDGTNPNGDIQKETMLMMNFAGNRHFVLGANYHGGTEVINYPWDGFTSSNKLHADNNWYAQISTQYVTIARINAPNYFKDTHSSGIIVGGDWYVIHGGRQDYMNYFHNCREITAEVSITKKPDSDQMPTFWNNNRDAMLDFIENVKYGIRGLVTNTDSEPLSVKVTALNHDKDNSHVFTNPQFGNYYRMLYAGTYKLRFEAFGYETQEISDIAVQNKKTKIVDVVMQKSPAFTINGVIVNASTGMPVENVTIEIKETPLAPLVADPSGNFSLTIPKGTYPFVFTKENFVKKEKIITINENTGFLVIPIEPFEGFSFEDGLVPQGFTLTGNQNWYVVSNQAYHGTKSIRSGGITHNQSTTMTYTFNAANAGKVSFFSKVSSEKNYDWLTFYIDNVEKGKWSGTADWAEHAYDVSAGSHTLKWTYSKDIGVSSGSDCAWVDYISVPKSTQNAVPYINPHSIAFETNAAKGDTLIAIWNIGYANFNFTATVENADWLSLKNNTGTLGMNEKNDIILSYDFTSLPNALYEATVQIEVEGSVTTIPVSILFKGAGNEIGIPYVTPKEIDIETHELTGECVVTMKNIGNKSFDYYLDLEPDACDAWLSLSHHSGTLKPDEQVEIILSYDFSSIVIAKGRETYFANLSIDVADSVIHIPININLLLNILNEKPDDLKIYPNPTTGEFQVTSYKLQMNNEKLITNNIEVFDVYGRKQNVEFHSSGLPVLWSYGLTVLQSYGLSTLPAGIYFLKVGNEVKRVVKL